MTDNDDYRLALEAAQQQHREDLQRIHQLLAEGLDPAILKGRLDAMLERDHDLDDDSEDPAGTLEVIT